MTISRKPTAPNDSAISAFISGAPDAHADVPRLAADKPVGRKPKRKISVDINPDLLARIDRAANASGISRNGVLAFAAARFIDDFEERQQR